MISVGILGASSPTAGELIRLLINHPDVDLKTVSDASKSGQKVSSVHHGLIGETDLVFTTDDDFSSLDVLFLCLDGRQVEEFMDSYVVAENQYIIDLSDRYRVQNQDSRFVYGLSELNRKPLVRGARLAVVPSAVASAALISLLPLFNESVIDADIDIEVTGGYDKIGDVETEILCQLRKIRPDFDAKVSITYSDAEIRRGIRVKTMVQSKMSTHDVVRMYQDLYDDHNMTFIVDRPVDFKEVEGTDKCLLYIQKADSGYIQIEAIVDGKLRGGAGDALHVMNLFCGLHEKIGLSLKVIGF